eukprot:102895-Rhodomonas_salina.1
MPGTDMDCIRVSCIRCEGLRKLFRWGARYWPIGACNAMSGTDLAHCTIVLCAYYAMSGTDLAYRGTTERAMRLFSAAERGPRGEVLPAKSNTIRCFPIHFVPGMPLISPRALLTYRRLVCASYGIHAAALAVQRVCVVVRYCRTGYVCCTEILPYGVSSTEASPYRVRGSEVGYGGTR